MDVSVDHMFKLYVSAMTPKTETSVNSFRQFCEKELEGEFDIRIINVIENPHLAEGDRILATPTLIRQVPEPVKRIIGDISNTKKVLAGLDLR